MFQERGQIIQLVIAIVALVFIVRLFFLQVLDSSYKLLADNNATEKIVQYPLRGLIYDRNMKPMVENSVVFDIYVTYKKINITDSLQFFKDFSITVNQWREFQALVKKDKSWLKPTVFIKQLSLKDMGRYENLVSKYKGVYIQNRTIRNYSHQSAANVLGYIGEISPDRLKKQKKEGSSYYQSGDYVGITGLENYYEEQLRGKRGAKFVMKDNHGAHKGSFRGGEFDTLSVPGEDLVSTIDLDLQQYGELLMQNKIGSVIAIEPSTGEILSFISAPSYDPNLLTGRQYSTNYDTLKKNPYKPLFNRPLQATYAPGSIWKIGQALVGMQLGVLSPSTVIPCNKTLVNCHAHPSPQNLMGSLQWSCNPWYYVAFKRIINRELSPNKYKDTEMGFDEWRKHIITFGFGQKLELDMPSVSRGFVPTNSFYDKVYGDGAWKHSTIRSLDIGQGELLIVPIQMANFAAIIANRGYYYTPHLVKSIGNTNRPLEKYLKRNYTSIDSSHYKYVIQGMEQVVLGGTAYWTKIEGLSICGKTGTVQNSAGQDHSVFIAFAPKDNPKIAIAVFVENAGFGAMTAAPIANLMIEKYLKGKISRQPMEEYILTKNLMPKVLTQTK